MSFRSFFFLVGREMVKSFIDVAQDSPRTDLGIPVKTKNPCIKPFPLPRDRLSIFNFTSRCFLLIVHTQFFKTSPPGLPPENPCTSQFPEYHHPGTFPLYWCKGNTRSFLYRLPLCVPRCRTSSNCFHGRGPKFISSGNNGFPPSFCGLYKSRS